ncbi:hypothetical protein [Alicyclobacillus sp. SP_1]|uniref:hypothetical protein n=1 Tax=Alicyclobacillus sp. SP_1 TaxID=2942475 RepID=UPI002157BDB8|nr:hypothetical protein [Alicyclobacillus sp. SP_1]
MQRLAWLMRLVSRGGGRVKSNLVLMMLGSLLLVGCGTAQVPAPNGGTSSAPAAFDPQIDGTIASIQTGSPSYAVLKNVTEIKKSSMNHKAEVKVKLPAGQFVSSDHWQSNGDTLDLFIGEDMSVMTNTGQIMESMPDQGFAGIVKSINSSRMVIQKVLYDSQTTHDSRAMKATNELVSIHLAPYTKVSMNGFGASQATSVIHQGDAVLFVLIGPPNEYIATQVTDFRSPSDAGWVMQK